jgi:hypothetical protein
MPCHERPFALKPAPPLPVPQFLNRDRVSVFRGARWRTPADNARTKLLQLQPFLRPSMAFLAVVVLDVNRTL